MNQVYGQTQQEIAIGSLKSNLGHLEAAAGLAAIVKVLLQMHYRTKVPSLHCEIENPLLGLDKTPFRVQKESAPWGSLKQTLYAGVSAFGAGGANGHVILESPPPEYAYTQIPRAIKKLDGSVAYWLDPEVKFDAQNKKQQVELDVERILWLTKMFESCDSPLSPSELQPFFLVTANQKQILSLVESAHSFILLHEAVAILDQYKPQKMVVINLTALDEIEDDTYLSAQFNLAQSLSNKKFSLDLITVTHSTSLSLASIYRASFDGLYRTLSLENPHINSLIIQSNESLTQIVSLLKKAQIKDKALGIYQWIGGHWNKQKFTEHQYLLRQQHRPLLKRGGVYVISGGLGALGQIISSCLLTQYDAHVICLGRSSLIGVKQEQFAKLYAINAKLEDYQVDVTDGLKVQETIRSILREHGRLDGVINSACVLNDGLLSEKSLMVFAEVVKSKIQGSINLDEATKDCSLDFFVSFSSMSAVYSNVGQSDYCMANTFVDYFMHYRERLVNNSQRSGKSYSINWPLWDVDGLSLSPQMIAYLCEATGIEPLNAALGANLFERLMDSKHPCQVVPLYGNPDEIRVKLLEQTAPEMQSLGHSIEHVREVVLECISQVTHLNKANLSAATSINELGMSSVLLAELASLIEERLGTPIAPSAFFSYNSVEKITQYLSPKIVHKAPMEADIATVQAPITNDEYAIIGLSALLPGGPEPEAFWQSLVNNQSAVRKVSRWQGDYFAATLESIKQFDNQFFNLSNKEAMLMDPQHRLFLQESYQALLNAGYPPSKMKQVGVFAGVQFNDYQNLLSRNKIPQHAYMATGNSHSMLANRVSYLFDFNGPSQTIDTACSSTLVAIHRGILALKNNECDLALCGAVSLLIDASVTDAANSMGVLSPNFRCATFDESADGYVRGEGVGVFVIKRLHEALRDGDAIHAVIASSAENHGGRANSLTAPNPIAQKELLLKAYKGSLAQQVSYIETHGTGTRLGDPIELDALTQAFKQLLPAANEKCIMLGSVKTNVGHLEPAAGVAAMVKVIYALKHKILPANVHFKQMNPYINLDNTPFKILDSNSSWDSAERVAGISSFGFGGSYAHLVLKEAPVLSVLPSSKTAVYIPLSARKPELLQAMREQLLAFIKQEPTLSLEALSYMLCCGRDHFTHRFITRCTSIEELSIHLEQREMVYDDVITRAYYEQNEIDWQQHFPLKPNKIFIPGYVFEHKEFWFDSNGVESVAEIADDK